MPRTIIAFKSLGNKLAENEVPLPLCEGVAAIIAMAALDLPCEHCELTKLCYQVDVPASVQLPQSSDRWDQTLCSAMVQVQENLRVLPSLGC